MQENDQNPSLNLEYRFDLYEKTEDFIQKTYLIKETKKFIPVQIIAEAISKAYGFPVEAHLKKKIGKTLSALGAKPGVHRIGGQLYRGYYIEKI